jgi:hypothetical protein
MEESSFRQIWRIVNLLLKIDRRLGHEESEKRPSRSQNSYERKAA